MIGLLAAATLAVFWPVTHHAFLVYDDQPYVTDNPHVWSGLTWDNVWWAFTASHSYNWHPLTWVSHMVDVHLFGMTPGWHHATNLLLHVINTGLVFLLLLRMTAAVGRSGMVAALFALHPLHVESVAWIAERKDLLSTCLGLLALIAYARYALGTGARAVFYGLSLGTLALGLMSKAMLVTWPFVMLLLDVWPLARVGPGRDRRWVPLIVEKIPFFGLSVMSSVVTYVVQRRNGAVASLGGLPLFRRVGNAVEAYGGYLLKTVWPVDLSIFYPYDPARTGGVITASAWWSFDVLVAVSLVVVWLRRQGYLLTGWLWFLGTLVPVIGLVQVGSQAMADRYTYVPLIGLFVAGVWGVDAVRGYWQLPRWVSGVVGGVVLLPCLVLTSRQVRVWADNDAVFAHALALDPRNALAHYNVALGMLARGETSDAVTHLQAALALDPGYPDPAFSLGVLLASQGRTDDAVTQYEVAIQRDPNHVSAHNNLGLLLWARGQTDAAVSHFDHALRVDPYRAEAHNNLGLALASQRRLDEAATHFTAAIAVRPHFATALDNLGQVRLDQGRVEEALACFRQALDTHPEPPVVHLHLSQALARLERWREARAEIDAARQADPPIPWVLNDLAWMLATHPQAELRDGPLAVVLATRACESSGYGETLFVGTLAAALAEAGQFDAAVQSGTMAEQLATGAGRTDLAQRNAERLDLYRSRQPYRDAPAP